MIIKRIKTAHITNYYHKNSGGISNLYNQILEYANEHQREMILIVPGETDDIQEIGDFARIYFIRAKKSPFFDKRYKTYDFRLVVNAIQTAKNNNHKKLCEEAFSIYEEIYQKFHSQKNLFVHSEKPKNFNFSEKIAS